MEDHTSSESLGAAVALCAGIAYLPDIALSSGVLDKLYFQTELVRRAHHQFLENRRSFDVQGLGGISGWARELGTRNLIFASSQLGSAPLSLAAISFAGLKVVTAYWAINQSYLRIFQSCGVRLIDLNHQRNVVGFVRLLNNLRDDGYVVALLADVPNPAGRQYGFLGYQVRCARLIEAYADVSGCKIIPILCELSSDRAIILQAGEPIEPTNRATQALLTELEVSITKNPLNYHWSQRSILFSDPSAFYNGMRQIEKFLSWRTSYRLQSAAPQ